jgi:hypothetical protein
LRLDALGLASSKPRISAASGPVKDESRLARSLHRPLVGPEAGDPGEEGFYASPSVTQGI